MCCLGSRKDIVPLEEGIKIKSPEATIRQEHDEITIENWYAIYPVNVPAGVTLRKGKVNSILAGSGVTLHRGIVEEIGGNHFIRVSIGDNFVGRIDANMQEAGKTSFSPLKRNPKHTHDIPPNERMSSSLAEQLRSGEPVKLEMKDDKFFRMDDDYEGLEEDQIVYVMSRKGNRVMVMTDKGREYSVPTDKLSDEPLKFERDASKLGSLARNDYVDTFDVWAFKARRFDNFRSELHNASRDVSYLPEVDRSKIKVVKADVKLETTSGKESLKDRTVYVVKENRAQSTVLVETWDRKQATISVDEIKDTSDQSKNIFISRAYEHRQKTRNA